MLEEAKKRDHRKLGKELGIFTFDDNIGPGLPLWMPNGTVIIEELERLAKETETAAGYKRVVTPHIAKESLYITSGHLPYYQESMYPPMELEGVKYYLKAMNCPHHHKIFSAENRSYRELPLRLAEYGTCYRYEQSGELFGLMRVRCLHMNDAHIYCSKEDFANEFRAVNDMYIKYFNIFGIDKYVMRLSLHDPAKLGQKYINEPELWLETEEMVRQVLIESNIPFVEVPDEGAFYGPKLEYTLRDAIGREWQCGTTQVDFNLPTRFGAFYIAPDSEKTVPVMIHRAMFGSLERFTGILIEHHAGHFPLWLSPQQITVCTITQEADDYAMEIVAEARKRGLRIEADLRNEKINYKVREHSVAKVPHLLVVGMREAEEGKVAIRSLGSDGQRIMTLDEAIAMLSHEATPPDIR
jgi:threonyl-tRNA synthetase